jgi:hypothetical protein
MYSFENFPQNPSSYLKLTPRSQEALRRSGLAFDDLMVKSAEEVNKKYGNAPDNEKLMEKRLDHEEEKRRNRI